MHDLTAMGNLVEAGVWFVVTLILCGKAWMLTGVLRRTLIILAVTFLVFGLSDVIESQTGAWWRPAWLLLIKGSCLCVFVFGFWKYHRVLSTIESDPTRR